MKNSDLNVIEYLFRFGIGMTFFGHGVMAINGNPNWFQYLEVVGINSKVALNTLLSIGIIDVVVALFLVIKPYKAIIIWAIFWTFLTALIRPISGEPIWTFVERGIIWLSPIALLKLRKYNEEMRLKLNF